MLAKDMVDFYAIHLNTVLNLKKKIHLLFQFNL